MIFYRTILRASLCLITIMPLLAHTMPTQLGKDYYARAYAAQQAGDFATALHLYKNALRIEPTMLLAAFNAGVILQSQKEYTNALAFYQKAITIHDACAPAHYNMALCHKALNNADNCIAYLEKTLLCDPEHDKAYLALAEQHLEKKATEQARTVLRKLLTKNSCHAQALGLMGKSYAADDALADAVPYFQQSLAQNPENLTIQFDLANCLNLLGRMDEALPVYHQMAEQHPNMAELNYNYAYALKKVCRIEDAIPYYEAALRTRPTYASAHFSLSLAYLCMGDFKRGWPEYEWRWAAFKETARTYAQPVWDGSNLRNKRIFVYAEQGLGDTFQFIRYLPLLKAQGATIIFEVQKPLKAIFEQTPYIDELIVQGDPIPTSFDTHCALMSLPLACNTTQETVPAIIPYINARQDLVELWRDRLAHDTNLKIGICWQGNASYRTQALRYTVAAKSMSAATFAPLAQIPGVSFYSLQKVNGEEQLCNLPEGFVVHSFTTNFDDEHGRFMDTAALIKNLDLVITVDTSISHFAAALGAPVWILLPNPADWRWMLNRNDSPWYPNMRLFRQTNPGDWSELMQTVSAALADYVQTRQTPCA